MRWKNRPKPERPEYPKLVAVAGTVEEVRALMPPIIHRDSDAEVVDAGDLGVFVRVHNEAGEAAARLYGEPRSFPLA
jgi:hypothetical protein